MDGMAILTMDTSSRFMNPASSRMTRVSQRRGSAWLAVAGGARICASDDMISLRLDWRFPQLPKQISILAAYCLGCLDNRGVEVCQTTSRARPGMPGGANGTCPGP